MTLPNKRPALLPHGGEVGIFLACVASAVAAIWALGWMQKRQDELAADVRMTQPQAHPVSVTYGAKLASASEVADFMRKALHRHGADGWR